MLRPEYPDAGPSTALRLPPIAAASTANSSAAWATPSTPSGGGTGTRKPPASEALLARTRAMATPTSRASGRDTATAAAAAAIAAAAARLDTADTGLAAQTVHENQLAARTLVQQLNTYLQSGGAGGIRASGAAGPRHVLAVLDLDARDMVARDLVDLQVLVEAARAGDIYNVGRFPQRDGTAAAAGSSKDASSGAGAKATGANDRDRDRRAQDRKLLAAAGPVVPAATMRAPGFTNADRKGNHGRKSIRRIAEELEEKIQLLKNNPSQWEIFCARVAAYKEAKRMNRQLNVIQKNASDLPRFAPEVRKEMRDVERQQHDDHRRQVSATSQRLFDERQRFLQKLAERSMKEAKVKPVNPKLHALQYKWLILGAIASRFFVMQDLLRTNHAAFLVFKRQSWAARRIQRAWRRYRQLQHQRRERWAMRVLSRAFGKFVVKIRERRREQAANTIRDFLKEVHDVGKLLKIIKKFRFAVIQAQRISRGYLAVRTAQLQLLVLQWERFEADQMNQSRASAVEASADLGAQAASAKGKKPITKKKKEEPRKDDKPDTAVPSVPSKIREKLLLETLLAMRKDFQKKKLAYAYAMQQYNAEAVRHSASPSGDPPKPPVRPWMKLLLTSTALAALIKRAQST
ncbi:hypothetical protein GGF31_005748 [Allomyces arbusculus]|nr:hypothetical protein GGF31_005748 [Allomyces arbusculus]